MLEIYVVTALGLLFGLGLMALGTKMRNIPIQFFGGLIFGATALFWAIWLLYLLWYVISQH
jgi:hypothetical protein